MRLKNKWLLHPPVSYSLTDKRFEATYTRHNHKLKAVIFAVDEAAARERINRHLGSVENLFITQTLPTP
jgi:hypothetical protein